MHKFKAKLSIFLVLCIFLCSVNSMKVEATSIVAGAGITAASLFEICLFVGGVALTCYAAGEVIENREEIAEFGKNFLDSVSDVADGWIMNFTDVSGQEYVFGSEALELVQDTPWEVIQGGAPNGDDDNNDNNDDDDKKGWLNFASPSSQLYASFTALGATWFADSASKLYQKWVNGDELTESEQAALKPLMEAGVDQNGIAQQWSGELFPYSATIYDSYTTGYGSASQQNILTVDSAFPHCAAFWTDGIWRYFEVYTLNEKNTVIRANMDLEFISYIDGRLSQHDFYKNRDNWSMPVTNDMKNFIMSYSVNFPVFSSRIDAQAYLKGTCPVTDALNYAKTYQNADWLSDDWKGLLIDPLTNIGLSLSQLIDLAKALGVHAVGNNLSAQELADLLKQSLPAINPELMPDAVPAPSVVPNPDLLPIYYPSPTAHPLPGTDPGTNPGTNPGDNTDPIPDVDKPPLGDLTEDNAEEKTDSIIDSVMPVFTDIGLELQKKFPFSIPWDIYNILSFLGSGDYGTATMSYSLDDSGIVLFADDGGSHGGSGGSRPGGSTSGGGASRPSGAPVFQVPFQISKSLGIEGTVLIDLEPFQVLSDISRTMFTCIFCLSLLQLTLKIFDSLVNFFPAD